MKKVIIVQARMGSTRLPGKILKKNIDKPLLSYQIERLRRVSLADEVVIATTINPKDQVIVDLCHQEQIPVFRGSEDNVLERYFQAAQYFKADVVIRVTSDCPLIDPKVIDHVIDFYIKNYPSYQYVSNTLERTYPRGMDVEVFSFKVLEKAFKASTSKAEKEHVTLYMYQHPEIFALANIALSPNASHHRWTVDTPEDFELISLILKALYIKNPQFTMEDILALLKHHPEWEKLNAHVIQKS